MGHSVNPEIDVIVYKRESFDSDRFREDLASYTSNFIFLLFDSNGIMCIYSPVGCKIAKTRVNFLRFKNHTLYYCFYPVAFLVDNIRIFKLFLTLCLRFRVKAILMETYSSAFVGILRRCNLTKRMIYVTTDWFAGNKKMKGVWSGLGGDIIFPFFDYLACKLSDITLNLTEFQRDAWYHFWGRRITKREILFMHHLEIKNKSAGPDSRKAKIVFIGEVRNDSGLELVIKSLNTIRKKANFSIKIIGLVNSLHGDLNVLAKQCNIEKHVEFLGFIERVFYNGHLVKLYQIILDKLHLVDNVKWWLMENKDINESFTGIQLNAIYRKK